MKIVEATELKGSEAVIEIGAGVGSLSAFLSESAGRLEAVEIDARLLPPLNFIAGFYDNMHPIHADALQLNISQMIGSEPYVVVGNIPYNITSHLIRNLLEQHHQPKRMVLTIQREVAQRILAEPGEMNLLALGVQAYGAPSVYGNIAAGAFYPPPKVESSILVVDPYETPMISMENLDRVFLLARMAFNQKRKQLRNSLAGDHVLREIGLEDAFKKAEVDPTSRPQSLSLPDWLRLAQIG